MAHQMAHRRFNYRGLSNLIQISDFILWCDIQCVFYLSLPYVIFDRITERIFVCQSNGEILLSGFCHVQEKMGMH